TSLYCHAQLFTESGQALQDTWQATLRIPTAALSITASTVHGLFRTCLTSVLDKDIGHIR
ncbi:hypothetical protein ACJX0J_026526, partial [Zea mays]